MVIRYSHDFKASLWALVTLSRFKPIYILASGDNNLSINLKGSAPAAPAATLSGDLKKAINTHGAADTGDDTYIMSTDGSNNYTPDPSAPDGEANALGLISGTAGDDVIDGGGGSDALSGKAGDDTIIGRQAANDFTFNLTQRKAA